MSGHGLPASPAHDMTAVATPAGHAMEPDVHDAAMEVSGALRTSLMTSPQAVGPGALTVTAVGLGLGEHRGMAELCMAVLVGLFIALLGWLRTASTRAVHTAQPIRVSPVTVRGRDPDPPSLTRLSISRC